MKTYTEAQMHKKTDLNKLSMQSNANIRDIYQFWIEGFATLGLRLQVITQIDLKQVLMAQNM